VRAKALKAVFVSAAAMALLLLQGCAKRADSATGRSAPPPIVSVLRPQRGEMVRSIELPGDVVGYYEVALHAKVTGYLKSIYVDKGDWVKSGQLLAVIEVPELHANLQRALAGLAIQRVTYKRLVRVQRTDPRLVSQEDVDMAYAKYQEAKAAVRTLETMVSYTQIVAPFDGVITGRFADPGALIRAGGGDFGVNETSGLISPGATEGAGGHRTGGGPVLTLAYMDKLRIYVYVPEGSYPLVQRGTRAILRFDEFSNRTFTGEVARYATSLDLATRTMLTEIDLKNPSHLIYPRSYAHVTLELVRHPNALRIPTAAVQGIGRSEHVFVVRNGRLIRVRVSTGISNGSEVEVTSGLSDKDLVVSTFSNALSAGEKVRFTMPRMTASRATGAEAGAS
jgi:membrane fusion protein (multidrug efflux system)